MSTRVDLDLRPGRPGVGISPVDATKNLRVSYAWLTNDEAAELAAALLGVIAINGGDSEIFAVELDRIRTALEDTIDMLRVEREKADNRRPCPHCDRRISPQNYSRHVATHERAA